MIDDRRVEGLLLLKERADQRPDEPAEAAAPSRAQVRSVGGDQLPLLVERRDLPVVEQRRSVRQLGRRRDRWSSFVSARL